ncbi:MAG: phosphoribosylglycinamide formyltransferase [Paracoccaceae bacterium]
MKKRVAFLISGGGSNMAALVRDMTGDHPCEPVLVFSNNPGAGGLKIATDMGIPTASIDHRTFKKDRAAFDAALHAELVTAKPDIICHAGFMRILTPDMVARWQGKMLNIHPSILPLFAGLRTHQQALDAGMNVHGCSVHIVTPELDAGPILGQAVMSVLAGDTPESLAKRLLPLEHRLYPAVLRKFATGDTSPTCLFQE